MSLSSSASACSATVQRILGTFERFLSRNKIAAVVFTAYVSLMVKLWNAADPNSSQQVAGPSFESYSGSEFQTLEPLDRTTVLARAKLVPVLGSDKQATKKVVLRREMSQDVERKNCSSELIDEDPAVLLKRFLVGKEAQNIPDEDQRLAWQALGKLYSARGFHKEALEAQRSAVASDSTEDEDDLGDDLDLLATIVKEDCLHGRFENDPEGFLSLAQLGAAYLIKEPSTRGATASAAEDEVQQWLAALGQARTSGCGADFAPMLEMCPA